MINRGTCSRESYAIFEDKTFQLSLHSVNNSLTDWTVYFIIIDTKKINSRDGRNTKKKYYLCSFGVASFGSKDKPIRNRGILYNF